MITIKTEGEKVIIEGTVEQVIRVLETNYDYNETIKVIVEGS
ncbi:MAG TPA: hypothetical protein PKN88_10515 [Bacillota bacterium]|jgi:hypothetical protein|nr:hypothetical protein [Bacillota bacterium]